jgi:hypothetical protein
MPTIRLLRASLCFAALGVLALAGISESPAGQVKKDKVKPDLVVPKEPPVAGIKDGTFVKPAASAAPTSYFYAVSSAKDEFIGQGETIAYDGDKLRVMEVKDGTKIRLGVAKKSDWELIVAPPMGGTLKVGDYLDAKLYPDNGKAPGLEFKGMNRESAKVAGKFVVWEYEVAKGVVMKLAIDFIQQSEETGPPLYGVVRYNSSFK